MEDTGETIFLVNVNTDDVTVSHTTGRQTPEGAHARTHLEAELSHGPERSLCDGLLWKLAVSSWQVRGRVANLDVPQRHSQHRERDCTLRA